MSTQYHQSPFATNLRLNSGQTTGMQPQTWTISPQERASHEQIFYSLRPISGRITGAQAKSYLMRSNLPPMTLAHVWNLSDTDGDGQMTLDEFSIAMHLIQLRLQGVDLPQALPPSLRTKSSVGLSQQQHFVSPQRAVTSGGVKFSVSHPGMPMYNTGSSATLPNPRKQSALAVGEKPLLGSSGLKRTESFQPEKKKIQNRQTEDDVPWAVQTSAKKKYNQMFNAHDRLRSGFLTGVQARAILLQSNLSQQHLAQIWSLADIDNDGRLSNEEFAVAMHLVDEVHAGRQLPTSVPISLIPPSMRRKRSLQQQAPSAITTDKPIATLDRKSSFPVHTQSFEDKKRENFVRGQLELEKRRQERREKEQKEKEEKVRKRREALERQERERQEAEERRREAEERRVAELELERQKEINKVRLEDDELQRVSQQRQSAQREMELAREREWQKRRKQELESQKLKVAELVTNLKQRARTVNVEMETLSQRYEGMLTMMKTNRSQIEETNLLFSRLSQSRDTRTADLERLHNDLTTATQRLNFLSEARERLTQELKTKDRSPGAMLYQSVMDQCRDKMVAINKRRSEHREQQEKLAEKTRERNAHQAQLMELSHSCESLVVDVKRLQHELNARNKENEAEQRRRAEQLRVREEETRRQRDKLGRMRRAVEETRKQEEEERRRKEDEARRKREEELAAVQREQEDKKMREQQKQKEAEEARKRVLDSSTKEARDVADGKQVSKAKRDADHQMKLVQTAARKRAELDADAERRSQELVERQQKEKKVRIEVERLHKQRAQLLELKKKQEQDAARQAADEVKRKEEGRLRKVAEEAERQQEIRQREEALQQQKAIEEAKRKLEAVKQQKLAEESKKKEREQADAKKKEIEARKQALLAKKAQLLKDRTTAAHSAPATAAVRYRAKFDFTGRSGHELSFKHGDILTVKNTTQEVEDGWMMGELNGRDGLFPQNYCVQLEAVASPQTQRKIRDSKSRSPTPPQSSSVPVAKPRPTIRNPSPLSTSSGDDAVPEKMMKRRETSPSGLAPSVVMSYQYHSAPCSPTRQLSPVESDGEEKRTEEKSRHLRASSADSFKVIALYPWRAQKDDHLSFGKDDVIAVRDQNEMWYNGELGGKTGWFPKSYVKQITVRKTVSASALPGTQPSDSSVDGLSTSPETSAEPVEKGVVRPQEYVALYNYSGSAGDLSFKAGDVIDVMQMTGEWWTGTLGNRKGIFPANYVKRKQTRETTVKDLGPVSHARTVSSPVVDGDTTVKRPLLAAVVAGYEALGPEQLSLQPGQLIHVKKQNPNGWWEGELQARGRKRKVGWFPSNRVKLMGNPFQTAAATRANSIVRRGSKDDSSQSSSSSVQNSPKGDNHVLAIYSYTAASEDELTFNKGSVITVLSKESEWWKGELNGVVGVFPSNYVQPLSELQPPSSQQWSDTISPVILQGLGDSERKRQEAIFELVQTEQSYVDSLNLVVEIFMEPMAVNGILEQEELVAVFVNWRELIASNYKLLKALNVRLKMHEGEPIPMIGDILCELLPRLTAYIRFCSRQLNACNVLQLKNSPTLREFETKCAQDSRTGGLRLSTFLLKPMQRVTKYPLLVQKILEYTPSDHGDHEPLAAAQKKAEELCSQVNEGVRMQENSDRLEWFQTHINTTGLPEELVFNSSTNCMGPRKLLFSGNLRKARSGRELFAVLCNDFLMLTQAVSRNPITAMFDSSSNVKYDIYRKPLFVDELMVQPASSAQYTDECHFYLSCGDEKPLILKADSPNERNSWIQRITEASESYRRRKKYLDLQEETLRKSRGQGVGLLIVTVVEASNLIVGDITGKSDPYCVVGLGVQTQKTPVVEKTLNPKWSTRMEFVVRDENQDRLSITVFDRDFFSPSDFLGRAEVLLADLLKDGKGPWNKWYVLQEVTSGEVHVRLDLKFRRGASRD